MSQTGHHAHRRSAPAVFGLAGLLLSCTTLLSSTGCSQHSSVVRGQNPAQVPQMPAGSAVSYEHGMPAAPMYVDGSAYGMTDCPVCPPQTQIDVWRPTHHHTWEYNPPSGLSYPMPNQRPAVIQYPYYTVRGPTDFFYQ